MIRIAAAPNAFRGSLSAFAACEAIRAGLERAARLTGTPFEIDLLPMADGGDGTLDVLLHGLGGERITLPCTRADGEAAEAEIGIVADGTTAIIELARASGLEILPPARRDPAQTTTYGTGELIRAALERGCRSLLIGIGGSATNDGGAGALMALGARLLDAEGNSIALGGGGLGRLARIEADDLRARLAGMSITILCDVDNPLIGERGASFTFAPQKGASPTLCAELELNLRHFAAIVQRDLGAEIAMLSGGGAAGGFGGGLAGVGAALEPGGMAILRRLGYAERIARAALVITGEGKLDGQTAGGKAVQAVASAAAAVGVPVIAFCGALNMTPEALRKLGIAAAFGIAPHPAALKESMAQAAVWLESAAAQVGMLTDALSQR